MFARGYRSPGQDPIEPAAKYHKPTGHLGTEPRLDLFHSPDAYRDSSTVIAGPEIVRHFDELRGRVRDGAKNSQECCRIPSINDAHLAAAPGPLSLAGNTRAVKLRWLTLCNTVHDTCHAPRSWHPCKPLQLVISNAASISVSTAPTWTSRGQAGTLAELYCHFQLHASEITASGPRQHAPNAESEAMVVSACPTEILRILASDHGSSSDLEHVLLQRMNLKVRPAKTTSYPPRGKELGEDVRVAWGRGKEEADTRLPAESACTGARLCSLVTTLCSQYRARLLFALAALSLVLWSSSEAIG